ncbi:MAG: ABC transporter ATP-binding protein [Anaerolineales bacterium]|nr:ABC transporter ATP-binding protein [Anaerolineales bacterium]
MFGFRSNGSKNSNDGALLKLSQVVKTYQGLAGDVVALKGIDLQIQAGEFVAVTGKSGSGKTTLINMITGLDRPTSGEIWVAGAAVHQLRPEKAARWRGQTVGVVFQTFELIPTLSVLHNVTLPMDFANRYSLRQQRQRALDLLEQVEIAEHAHKLPSEVSGGQQQRVAIARAMANDPPILAADEPTGSLDSATSEAVIDLFEELVKQGKTVVLVTHDQDIARRATRTIVLADGQIAADNGQAGKSQEVSRHA